MRRPGSESGSAACANATQKTAAAVMARAALTDPFIGRSFTSGGFGETEDAQYNSGSRFVLWCRCVDVLEFALKIVPRIEIPVVKLFQLIAHGILVGDVGFKSLVKGLRFINLLQAFHPRLGERCK